MRFPVQTGRGRIAKEWSCVVGKAGGKSAIGCCFRLFFAFVVLLHCLMCMKLAQYTVLTRKSVTECLVFVVKLHGTL